MHTHMPTWHVKPFTTLAVATIVAFSSLAPTAHASEAVQRTSGPDRIATSVLASQEHRPSAADALLATADSFPDALGAAALAGRLGGPLLLTEPDRVPDAVAGELERLGVERVWLLGGPGAVSHEVEVDLARRGYVIQRLAGDNRYGTAAEIAMRAGPSATGEVIVALGEHSDPERAWADALAASALAGAPSHVPALLTRPHELPEETEDALTRLGTSQVLLLGGTAAIGEAVETRLRSQGFDVRRIAGHDRYDTSVAVATLAVERAGAGTEIVFASGGDFPDALSAGALATAVGGPLVLVPPSRLADGVDAFVRRHHTRWDHGVLVGGTSAASEWVARELSAALGNEPRPEPEPQPEPAEDSERVVSVFEGQASWYGGSFHGRTTACGEVFDRNALTAAHRNLPCGTRVRVTNTSNGAQVVVRITDRGPYSHGRVLDVSERAAHDLGFHSQGTTWVRGEILE